MRERITRGMLDRQLAIFAQHYPAPDGEHWFLEKHSPGDRVYWRLCMGRDDLTGGVTDSLVTCRGYSTREMFEVLYFANRAAYLPERLKRGSGLS